VDKSIDPFERHGVRYLSPSSLNLFQNEPALWTLRYLFGLKDDSGPAAKRGSAVEAGMDVILYEGTVEEAHKVALDNFALNTGGLADAEHEKERALIPGMLTMAIEASSKFPKWPNSRQLRVEHRFEGIEVPVIGYVDYLWQDWGLDLKTTQRMPNSPKADHVRQIALYAAAKQRPFKLLYVTDKRHSLFSVEPEDLDVMLADMRRIALSLRKILAKSDCREEVTEFFNPNWDSFYWSDEARKEASRIWS
jgi:hypothetical protein